MQGDREPFRGKITYPYNEEERAEQERSRAAEKLANPETSQEKVNARVEAPSQAVENPFNRKIIAGSETFDDLILRIRVNGVTVQGSQEQFTPEKLIGVIDKIRNGDGKLERATSSDGFRDKVAELLKKEIDAKKISETSSDINEMIESEPAATETIAPEPAAPAKPKRGFFARLLGRK